MPTVLLPRSLLALFPGIDRRHEVDGDTVAAILSALDARAPGMRDRLVEEGPRLRPHINVFVDGQPADLTTQVGPAATVHVIPAVSGGETTDPRSSSCMAGDDRDTRLHQTQTTPRPDAFGRAAAHLRRRPMPPPGDSALRRR